jgi:hypothetical protein
MRILIATAALLLTVPTLAQAGNADGSSVHGQFYVFTAPIVSNTQYYWNYPYTAVGGNNTGFGGEVLVRKGVGVGVELGYAGPDWSFSGNGAIGIGSANGSYHFFGTKSRSRVDPFATGGYSLYFGQRTTFKSGFNFGGGVNIWVVKHAALRLEVRGQGGINTFDGFSQFTHYAAFRFGMTFR